MTHRPERPGELAGPAVLLTALADDALRLRHELDSGLAGLDRARQPA